MKFDKLVTFKVDEEMKEKMEKFKKRINWSAWFRENLNEKIMQLENEFEKSRINFCGQCGEMLSATNARFCDKCGAPVPRVVQK